MQKNKIEFTPNVDFAKAKAQIANEVSKLATQITTEYNKIAKSLSLPEMSNQDGLRLANELYKEQVAQLKLLQAEQKALNDLQQNPGNLNSSEIEKMARVREQTELARQAEVKRQELLQSSAANAALEQQFVTVQKINQAISSGGINNQVAGVTSQYQKLDTVSQTLAADYQRLISLQSQLSKPMGTQQLISTYNQYNEVLKRVNNSLSVQAKAQASAGQMTSFTQGIAKAKSELASLSSQWSALFKNKGLASEFTSLKQSLNGITNATQLKDWNAQLGIFKNEVKGAGLATKSFGDSLLANAAKFTSWIGITTVFMTAWRGLKSMMSSVYDLDTALVDLKKTTDATSEQLEQFYYQSNEVAKQLGVTTEQVIQATSDWSRLGYSIKEATELAKTTSIFKAISPEMSMEQASTSMISVIKAYGIEAEDALDGVASKINEVGNNFAVSNNDLAEILKRSASSMVAANTSLEQTIALGVSANEIVQDSASVGTALKTVSARIRGLDESGHELDETLSNIKGDIYDSTNGKVTIMKDDDTYKDIYTILHDISEITDELSDKKLADLNELLFGKRQLNIGTAILQNMSQADAALETMKNSAGGAMQEMDIITESLEYKLNALKETGIGIAQNLFQRDDMKLIVDSATSLLDIIDKLTEKLGLFGTVIATIGITKLVKNASSLSALGATLTQFNAVTASSTAISAKGMSVNMAYAASLANVSMAEKVSIISRNQLTEAQARGILVASGLTGEELKSAMATYTQATAQKTATASTLSLSNGFKGLAASIGISTTALGVLVAGMAAISVGVIAFNSYRQAQEEARQAAQDSVKALQEQTSSIDESVKKYRELRQALLDAKGDEEETYNIKKQLLDLQEDLNSKFGDEYEKLNLVTDAYNDQTDAIKRYNEEAAKRYLNENKSAIDKAQSEMTKDRSYSISGAGSSGFGEKDYNTIKDIADKYDSISIGKGNLNTYSITVKADASEANEQINAFMNDLREKEDEINAGVFDSISAMSEKALKDSQKVISKYGEIYKESQLSSIASDSDLSETFEDATKAVEAYNEAVLQSENPFDDSKVDNAYNNLQLIKGEMDGNIETWGQYSSVTEELFNGADTALYEFNKGLVDNSNSISDTLARLKEENLDKADMEAMIDSEQISSDVQAIIDYANTLGVSVDDVISSLIRLGYVQGEVASKSENVPKSVSEWMNESKDSIDDLQKDIDSLGGALEKLSSGEYSSAELVDSIQQINEVMSSMGSDINWDFISQAEDPLAQLGDTVEYVTEKYIDNMNASDEFKQILKDMVAESISAAAGLDAINTNLDSAQSAYSTLSAAVDEYNQYGAYSIDTVQALLALKPQYLALLVDENGKLALNEQGVRSLIEAQLAEAQSEIYGQAIKELNALASQKSGEASTEAANKKLDAVGNINSETDALNTNTEAKMKNAAADALKAGVDQKDVDKIVSDTQARIAAIQGAVKGMTFNVGGTVSGFKSSGGGGSKKDPAKELKEKYDKLIKQILSSTDEVENTIETSKQKLEMAEALGNTATVDKINKQLFDLYTKRKNLIHTQAEELRKLLATTKDKEIRATIDDKIIDLQKKYHEIQMDLIEDRIKAIEKLHDKTMDALKAELDYLDNKRILMNSDSDEYKATYNDEYDVILKQQKATIESINNLKKQGFSEESEEIQDLKDEWNGYEKNRLSAIKQIAEFNKESQSENLEKSKDALDNLLDMTIDMLKQKYEDEKDAISERYDAEIDAASKRYDDEIDMIEKVSKAREKAIQDEIDGYRAIIEAKKKALEREQDDRSYQSGLTEKQKDIADKENRLDILAKDDSDKAKAEYKKLYAELQEAKKDLDDYQYDHSIETQQNALDDELEKYENAKEAELEALQEANERELEIYKDAKDRELEALKAQKDSELNAIDDYLKKEGNLRTEALNLIKGKNKEFYDQLSQWNSDYGDKSAQELEEIWNTGYNAMQVYNDGLNDVLATLERINSESERIETAPLSSFVDSGKFDTNVGNVDTAIKNSSSKTISQDKKTSSNDLINQQKYLHDLMVEAQKDDNTGLQTWIKQRRKELGMDANGVIKKYHDGGFVGGLKSNEEFAKLLRGEFVATEGMQNNFMKNILPKIADFSGASGNYGNITLHVDKLLEVGTIDKGVDVEALTNGVFNGVVKKLNGIVSIKHG